MKLYRVTGWNPKTRAESDIGEFQADSREEVIAKARTAETADLVFDAVEVETNRKGDGN
jgi:hypothetical protein